MDNKKRPSRKGYRNKSELERIGEIVASIAGMDNSEIVELYEEHESMRNRRIDKNDDPIRSETRNKKLTGWSSWMKAGGMDPDNEHVKNFCQRLIKASNKPHATFDV